MNTSKLTVAKWHVGAGDNRLVFASSHCKPIAKCESATIARLIATLPSMLKACQKAKLLYESTFEVTGGCDHSVGICECNDRRDYEALCEVVALATGESS